MCFSEPASFGLAATLVPAGIYCLRKAWHASARHFALACLPIGFACQQAIEGIVWHGINNGDPELVFYGARGFVFFSHFFWLLFVPFASLVLETDQRQRFMLTLLTLIGGLFGASLFLPLVFDADRLSVELVRNSIEYKTILLYDGLIGRQVVRIFYSLIIILALLMSSDRTIRVFGGIIVASVLFADLFYNHAFISVWCFFAAALSLFVVLIMYTLKASDSLPAASPSNGAS